MKLQIKSIDSDGRVMHATEVALESSSSGLVRLDDFPIDLEPLGRRYIFLSFEPITGKLTLSLRVKPLLGHRGFHANVAEFEVFAELKQLPATFHHRVNENLLIKINLLI